MTGKRRACAFCAMGAALIAACLMSLLMGSARLTFAQAMGGLFGSGEDTCGVIMRHIRLPRTLAGVLAGAGLSLAGALLQQVTGNGLAGPNLIGVNGGAGLAAICVMAFFPALMPLMPLAAFLGAFAAALAICALAGRMNASPGGVILAGMALTALMNAGISAAALVNSDVAGIYSYFSVGGLSGAALDRLWLPGALIALSGAAAQLLAPRIQTLSLGDSLAASLGIRVKRLRTGCLLLAAAAAGAAVSFAGLLGFVGLMVPHMAKKLVGENVKHLLPACLLLGGTLVTAADTLGRVVLAPTEVPVGIVMAAVGVPFFLTLLMRRGRHA